MLQGTEQLVVIPLVEPDAGLVQDVGHAHQPGADLSGQADSLGLPTGEGAGGSCQSQVVQPHIHEELDPCPDFLQNLPADQRLLVCQLQVLQEFLQLFHREGRDLGYIHISHCHRQGGLLQPLSPALVTGGDAHKGLILRFGRLRASLPVSALHTLDQPLKGHIVNSLSSLAAIVHLHLFAACPVNQDVVDFLRIVLKGRAQGKFVLLSQRLQDGPCVASLVRAGLPSQHHNSSLVDAQRFVGNHQILVKLHLVAQSVALRAGPKGVVERKAPGLDLVNADTAVRAGKALAEIHGLPADHIHQEKSLRQVEHTLHRVCQALLDARLYHKTVHNDLNIVFDVLVQRDLL